jgi:hypothetical protein
MGTSPEPDPPLFPDELVATAGERSVLETFLDLYRGAIVRKVGGVSPHPRMGEVSLRWIDVHMIEETAPPRRPRRHPP